MFELVVLASALAALAELVLTSAGYVDVRPLRFHSAAPAGSMRFGACIAVIGCVWTDRIWWAVFPVFVLVAELVILSIGEACAAHRTRDRWPSGPASGNAQVAAGPRREVGSQEASSPASQSLRSRLRSA